MMNLSTRRGRAVIALAAALTLLGGVAEARVGRGGGFGSRGGRTFDAPPVTRTAPNPAGPIKRSQAPQNQFQNRPGMPPAGQVAQPRGFGFGTGLFAGLFGAGLLGMLFGNGFFGGLAGLGSFLGLLLQLALVAFLISLCGAVVPSPAGARDGRRLWPLRLGRPGPAGRAARAARRRSRRAWAALASAAAAVPGQDAPRRPGVQDEVGIGEKDYAAFERALIEVQAPIRAATWRRSGASRRPRWPATSRRSSTRTPRRASSTRSANVRLVQGDLAEAWREGDDRLRDGRDALRPYGRHDREGDRPRRRGRSGPARSRRRSSGRSAATAAAPGSSRRSSRR